MSPGRASTGNVLSELIHIFTLAQNPCHKNCVQYMLFRESLSTGLINIMVDKNYGKLNVWLKG